jgi:4-hydroxy-2-oxoheptanedioate aldolase
LQLGGEEPLFGGWCTLPSSFAAELVAHCGVDYAVVDMQHGLSGYSDLVPMMQAIALSGIAPMVRIPFGDLGTAQRALDAGAMGLIIPMVNDEAFAKLAVQACRYPPLGERSYGPIRSRLHVGADTEWVNSQVMCLVQIETKS